MGDSLKTTPDYDRGYDACLQDLFDEFKSHGMEGAQNMVGFRLFGQGGQTMRTTQTTTEQ